MPATHLDGLSHSYGRTIARATQSSVCGEGDPGFWQCPAREEGGEDRDRRREGGREGGGSERARQSVRERRKESERGDPSPSLSFFLAGLRGYRSTFVKAQRCVMLRANISAEWPSSPLWSVGSAPFSSR